MKQFYIITYSTMKQFNVTVLAKWQVVIPKELRDELAIDVWTSLSCFMRWSAVVLKKKIQTVSYWSTADWDQLPFWVDAEGKTLSVAINEMKGITYLLWKPWFGKSVHALNMMINMYVSWKSIVVFDPYGDLISEIKNYIADLGEESVYHYIVGESNDRSSLKKKIAQDKKQKIIAISTNFQWIWAKASSELSKPIILDCYKELVNDETMVFLDEFETYFDEKLLWIIARSNCSTCLLDQWWDYLSREQVKLLLDKINHIAIYQVWWLTAKYLVDDFGLSHTVQDLRTIEKYHFYFHSSLGHKDAGKLLLWIYPLN